MTWSHVTYSVLVYLYKKRGSPLPSTIHYNFFFNFHSQSYNFLISYLFLIYENNLFYCSDLHSWFRISIYTPTTMNTCFIKIFSTSLKTMWLTCIYLHTKHHYEKEILIHWLRLVDNNEEHFTMDKMATSKFKYSKRTFFF